jgi:hypothetical protein
MEADMMFLQGSEISADAERKVERSRYLTRTLMIKVRGAG